MTADRTVPDYDDRRTLDETGIQFGTDKSSLHHNYLSFYDQYFKELRDRQIKILEIGVLGGASLRTWHAYFPNAQIIGVDISPYAQTLAGGRITIELADQSNIEELTQLGVKHGPFDIVIEDGSHMWEHQILSLKTLFPFVRNGGLYIAEDLQTNYGSETANYRGNSPISCVDFLKQLLDVRVGDRYYPIDALEDPFLRTYGPALGFMSFCHGACVLKKVYSTVDRSKICGLVLPGRDPERSYITLELVAHVANVGEVAGSDGYVHSGSDAAGLEGIAIKSHSELRGLLEYRVRFPDGRWSDWSQENEYAGTRGLAQNLTGLHVRLAEGLAGKYELETMGLFQGETAPVRSPNDEVCVSSPGRALYAVQINLMPVNE